EELFKNNLTYGQPKIYAYGKLVLYTADEDIIPGFDLLTTPEIKHIAMANPKTAPYGLAAEQAISFYKLYDSVNKKLIYGESIAQTNQFIDTRAAEIGFTAMSAVRSAPLKNSGNFIEVDQQSYDTLKQGMVLLKHKNTLTKESQAFYDFMSTAEAQQILKKFGYGLPSS
ncbi:MAG: molybdate ABC transporter substrate-binding protein, partial [Leeuwenhoekiella sp.]